MSRTLVAPNRAIGFAVAAAFAPAVSGAQAAAASSHVDVATIDARPQDLTTLDGIVLASYIDLYWDGHRWGITAASWDDERPGSPIPPELLK
jgi:hypothetical protein